MVLSGTSQRALYNLGLTYIPIINVNNNCSTGSTALYLANSAVKGGQVQCAMALGFERMKPGSLSTNFPDRASPLSLWRLRTEDLEREVIATNFGPSSARMFDNGAQEYFMKYGGSVEHLAKIGMPFLTCINLTLGTLISLKKSQAFIKQFLFSIPGWLECGTGFSSPKDYEESHKVHVQSYICV